MQRSPFFFLLAALGALGLTPRSAHAFEREWHLGAGAGMATANRYHLGPAANLYAAYGLSDVFDLRCELFGSGHELAREGAWLYGGKLGLAYKVDVIQWIPWVGLTAGYLGVSRELAPFTRGQPTAGLIAGLDYAATRNFGVGGAVSYDYAFHPGAAYASFFLRAEYRFGF